MADKSILIKCSFTPNTEHINVQTGIYANFVLSQQYFPCYIVNCENIEGEQCKLCLDIEVLLGEVDISLSAGNSFKLQRGPNILLGSGKVISLL